MSWFTDPNCEAAALAEVACVIYAVEMSFPSGYVRVHTGTGDLTVNGQVYTGVGTLGSISDIPDRASLTAEQWVYRLSCTDVSVVPESEIDNCFGRSVTEYEVWLNPETKAVIGYETRREGTMGRVRRRDGAQPAIEITCETILAELEQPDAWRYVTEHQERFFSGDTGCNHVRELDSVEVIWGGERVAPVGHPRLRGRT